MVFQATIDMLVGMKMTTTVAITLTTPYGVVTISYAIGHPPTKAVVDHISSGRSAIDLYSLCKSWFHKAIHLES